MAIIATGVPKRRFAANSSDPESRYASGGIQIFTKSLYPNTYFWGSKGQGCIVISSIGRK